MILLSADDVTGGGNIWLSVFALASLIVTVVIGPAVLEWVKARIAKRSGMLVPAGGGGLNAPIDTTAPGVTGINIEAMFRNITDLQNRVDKAEDALAVAHTQIRNLQLEAGFYKFVLEQIIHWGINDAGTPPRPVPEAIKALLQRGGWL